MNIFFILLLIALLAVLASLLMGILVMARGGETSKKYSNRLMRARVILQGVALILLLLALFTAR